MSTTETVYLKDYQIPNYLVETIDLIVELGEEETIVKSQLQIQANQHDGSQQPLFLNGEGLELISISLNGHELSADEYQLFDHGLTLLAPGKQCQLDTVVKIKPQHNTSLMGLYKSSGNFCTQCEAQGFRKITYYVDRPDNLAIYTVTIVADKEKYPKLLSNGNLVDQGEAEGGKHWCKWHDPHKKSSHLFALVAGTFDELTDTFTTMSGREVSLHLFIEPGNLDKAPHAMQALKLAMKWDEEVYGREYDLDIFMTVAVSDFNMGAMENKGLNIFNTKYILASPETATDTDYENVIRVVGHEYFHNWSGNRVGCRDWFQLSLKEGFTVFRDQSFTIDMTSPVKRIRDVFVLRSMQFTEDAGPMSHPIRPASYMEINNFYTLTVYEKGAEVIRMLHTLLGTEKFRQATDLYFQRFDGQAVTTDDFVDCMQEVSDIDLNQFRLWYSQSGTPIVTISDEYDASKQQYILHVKQHTPSTADQQEKHALHIPLRIALLDNQGNEILLQLQDEKHSADTSRVLNVTTDDQEFVFINIKEKPTPSLLRGFSAPVKLEYNYSQDQLQHLLKYDSDSFSRWEAGQLLAVNVLQKMIAQIQQRQEMSFDQELVATYRHILQLDAIDKTYQSYLLYLPTENYLADLMGEIDPLAIHQARQALVKYLAEQLREEWLVIYQANHEVKTYACNNTDNGQRAIKNLALQYLMQLQDETIERLALKQYQQANNMTDKSAALTCFANSESQYRQQLLTDFYQQYKNDALVLDKWFAMQAGSCLPNTLETVKKLMQHSAFDVKNPNKVRAVLAEFSRNNALNFHCLDGSGYAFLADQVIALDKINPQIAARLVQPLTHYKHYTEAHAKLMKKALEKIQQQDLSGDTFEVVSKALNG